MNNTNKAIDMVENNREDKPAIDHRLAEIFGKLGFLEGRMEEIEKKTNINAENQDKLERELFANIKDLKEIVNNIDKQLYASAALDKERQQTREAFALERREMDRAKREEKKSIYNLFPAIIDSTYKVFIIIGLFWGLFEVIDNKKQ